MLLNIIKDFYIFRVGFFIVLMMSSLSNVYATTTSHPSPTLHNQFSKWSVYQYPDLDKTVCFALSIPNVSEPESVKHGINFFIVSAKNKTSDSYLPELVMDYPLDEETMVSVEVSGKYSSGQIFKMKPHNNRAVFEKRFYDDMLIKEMRSGKELIVSARSKRGTNTRYVYSLTGLSNAIADVLKCK
ncbi:hypothetical protein [Candidatus Liberibacter brunswickensis]|uniref:hypothetical protein n=1 Tax=Candidatus Liberibacter brunswickensis TaxID=1968796 RepID=UPI002FE03A0A